MEPVTFPAGMPNNNPAIIETHKNDRTAFTLKTEINMINKTIQNPTRSRSMNYKRYKIIW